MADIRLPAKLENLESLMSFVSDCAEENGFEGKRAQEIQLATEEALVNIFNHAYTGGRSGDVHILCRPAEEDRLIVEFRDQGVPFDPAHTAEPDLNTSIAGRPIGGLGIFLIKKMIDDVRYRREGGENVLTFVLHRPSLPGDR